jgi:aminoglycoside phosphotransferase (APT) family kinase protein
MTRTIPRSPVTETSDLVDPARLAAWMDAQGLPGAGAPIEHSMIAGGSQNEIFEIRRGEFRCALRRPPRKAPPGRDEGILREWRIIEALSGTDVPHTEAVAVCTDQSVLGCNFYLMGFVDGWSPMSTNGWPAPFDTDLDARRDLALELVDGTAKLSKVDWRAKGLTDLGRPDGFHERQVDRWLSFLARVKTRELPGLDVATGWLRAHRPIDYVPGIMHGDYQFANVMFRHGAPARLAAIVDWEMGTVGDPKLDLAWVVQGWPAEGDDPAAGRSYVDLTGMPSRDELLDHYAKESGRQVDDIDYYVILARWKLAIVLEQGYSRAIQGAGDNEKLLAFGDIVLDLMAGAAALAESTDYRGPAVAAAGT